MVEGPPSFDGFAVVSADCIMAVIVLSLFLHIHYAFFKRLHDSPESGKPWPHTPDCFRDLHL
jgi:hypothetical protein